MKKLILIASILILAAVPVSAQTFLTNTTLSAATNATQTQVTLAADTNVAAGGVLFVDHEVMQIVSYNTTTNVATVIRGPRPAAHGNAAVVFVGTAAQKNTNFVPHENAISRAGLCSSSTSSTSATALSGMTLPVIDIITGDMYGCRRNGTGGTWVWNVTNVTGINGAGSIPLAQ